MSSAAKVGAPNAPRVVVGRLERVRRGKRIAFEPASSAAPVQPAAAKAALALALAHAIRCSIDSGAARDQADVARTLGMTRARVTQLLDMTLLDPSIQEKVLAAADSNPGAFTERSLRKLCFHDSWQVQSESLARLLET